MAKQIGAALGIVLAIAIMWLLPFSVGAIPGMFMGIAGAVIGGWLGEFIAKAK